MRKNPFSPERPESQILTDSEKNVSYIRQRACFHAILSSSGRLLCPDRWDGQMIRRKKGWPASRRSPDHIFSGFPEGSSHT